MESAQLKLLHQTLDDVRHQNGVEYWYARELFSVLGYSRWDSFASVIERAKEACARSGGVADDHFAPVSREIIKDGVGKVVDDIKLNRYACYLTALNGDPKKEEIAFAQAYFVLQTRSFELLTQKMEEMGRIEAREKLKLTEKDFSAMAISRGVEGKGIGRVRSAGDQALFGGLTTEKMKEKLVVPVKRPLADYLPDVTLKAKDLATAMTTENVRRENLHGENPIKNQHITSNQNVRNALTSTGIFPENLPAGEDIKKIEARQRKEMRDFVAKQKAELAAATNRNREERKGVV